MRKVVRQEGDNVEVIIESPWLTEQQATLYLDVSLSTLRRHFSRFAYCITARTRRYDREELDAVMKAQRADQADDANPVPPPYVRQKGDVSKLSITDPVTGRVHRCPTGIPSRAQREGA